MNHQTLGIVCASVCLLAARPSPAQVDVDFGTNGIASLRVAGEERLGSALPNIWKIGFSPAFEGSWKQFSHDFDPGTKTLSTTLPWGRIEQRYTPQPDGLVIDLTVFNTSQQTVTELAGISVLTLTGLGDVGKPNACWGVDEPHLVTAHGPGGAVVWSIAADAGPVGLSLQPQKQGLSLAITLGGDKIIVDNVTAARSIEPGGSASVRLRMQIAGPGTTGIELAGDALDAWRKTYPPLMDWPDRRPIFRLFFGGGLPKEQALANLRDPDSVTPPQPDPNFREKLLKRTQSCVEAAKVANAQGVILWDLEGDTFPHAVTYIGDPRHIRLLNPQMDLAIDDAVAILKDAGLLVGITLRPSRVVYDATKNAAVHSHTVAEDPLRELDGKITYARRRWGCRIFYIDTNFFWRPYGEEGTWKSARIAPDSWRQLKAKYPDTLFIPEFGGIADYQSCAVYGEADMGSYQMPEMASRLYPESFRVVVVEDADPYLNFDRFVETVRKGNVLMTFAYGTTRNVTAIARVYAHAALTTEQRDLPQAPEALVALAVDPAQPWGTRLEALRSLSRGSVPPSSATTLTTLVLQTEEGLYGMASKALAALGAPAHDPVLDAIESAVLSDTWNRHGTEQLGRVLTEIADGTEAARLNAIMTRMPDSKTAADRKRVLEAILGKLEPK